MLSPLTHCMDCPLLKLDILLPQTDSEDSGGIESCQGSGTLEGKELSKKELICSFAYTLTRALTGQGERLDILKWDFATG